MKLNVKYKLYNKSSEIFLYFIESYDFVINLYIFIIKVLRLPKARSELEEMNENSTF